MKIAIVGLGSMGKRRLRLSRLIDRECEIIGIDSNEERAREVAAEYDIQTVSSLDAAFALDPDCFLVCTAPLSHASILEQVIDRGYPVFTEINLVDAGYDRFIEQERTGKVFLSSTFLYRKDVRYLIEQCGDAKVSYIYHSGQYLPDWHPWEHFKDFFVGDKRTNGCREIFAIEFPWIIECFGAVTSVEVRKDTLSDLDLGYPDSYQLIVEHEGGNRGLLAVDVVSRRPVRHLEVYGNDLHLQWEGTPDSLVDYDIEGKRDKPISLYQDIHHDERYAASIIEDAYEEELRAFFTWVYDDDDTRVRYRFSKDSQVLSLIDEIEGQR